MRAILVLSALAAAAPVAANAQDTTDRRRLQAYENLRDLEQTQRLTEVERQLSNIELRQRSDQAMRMLTSQTPRSTNASQRPTPASALNAEDLARDAELAASNARLREIAERQRLRNRP